MGEVRANHYLIIAPREREAELRAAVPAGMVADSVGFLAAEDLRGGEATPERVRQAIRDHYQRVGGQRGAVVFVAADHVPIPSVAAPEGHGQAARSDAYYGDLTGSPLPELSVLRFADTASAAATLRAFADPAQNQQVINAALARVYQNPNFTVRVQALPEGDTVRPYYVIWDSRSQAVVMQLHAFHPTLARPMIDTEHGVYFPLPFGAGLRGVTGERPWRLVLDQSPELAGIHQQSFLFIPKDLRTIIDRGVGIPHQLLGFQKVPVIMPVGGPLPLYWIQASPAEPQIDTREISTRSATPPEKLFDDGDAVSFPDAVPDPNKAPTPEAAAPRPQLDLTRIGGSGDIKLGLKACVVVDTDGAMGPMATTVWPILHAVQQAIPAIARFALKFHVVTVRGDRATELGDGFSATDGGFDDLREALASVTFAGPPGQIELGLKQCLNLVTPDLDATIPKMIVVLGNPANVSTGPGIIAVPLGSGFQVPGVKNLPAPRSTEAAAAEIRTHLTSLGLAEEKLGAIANALAPYWPAANNDFPLAQRLRSITGQLLDIVAAPQRTATQHALLQQHLAASATQDDVLTAAVITAIGLLPDAELTAQVPALSRILMQEPHHASVPERILEVLVRPALLQQPEVRRLLIDARLRFPASGKHLDTALQPHLTEDEYRALGDQYHRLARMNPLALDPEQMLASSASLGTFYALLWMAEYTPSHAQRIATYHVLRKFVQGERAGLKQRPFSEMTTSILGNLLHRMAQRMVLREGALPELCIELFAPLYGDAEWFENYCGPRGGK